MPTGAAILAFLNQILASISSLLGIANNINATVHASDSSLGHIEDQVTETFTALTNDTDGLPIIKSTVLEIISQMAINQTALLAALGLTQKAANPVILPALPPVDVSTASTADLIDQIWNDPQPRMPTTPIDALRQIARVLNTTEAFDMNNAAGIFLVNNVAWGNESFYLGSVTIPVFDPTTLLAGDTLLSALTRQNPTFTCGYGWQTQMQVQLTPTDGSWVTYVTLITETDFDAIKAKFLPVEKLSASPVWPGLASVTLGVPVAISTGLTITTPMHGVIVNLTSEPSKSSFFTFDDENSYRNLGALSFRSDNGDQEPSQSLGFTSAVYSPKSMVKAAGVKLRFVGGVSGTVTPWVITAAA